MLFFFLGGKLSVLSPNPLINSFKLNEGNLTHLYSFEYVFIVWAWYQDSCLLYQSTKSFHVMNIILHFTGNIWSKWCILKCCVATTLAYSIEISVQFFGYKTFGKYLWDLCMRKIWSHGFSAYFGVKSICVGP